MTDGDEIRKAIDRLVAAAEEMGEVHYRYDEDEANEEFPLVVRRLLTARTALAEARAVVEALLTSPPPPPVITEAMVEAAAKAVYAFELGYPRDFEHIWTMHVRESGWAFEMKMRLVRARAALTAAFAQMEDDHASH